MAQPTGQVDRVSESFSSSPLRALPPVASLDDTQDATSVPTTTNHSPAACWINAQGTNELVASPFSRIVNT
jgi:hypothetical protein